MDTKTVDSPQDNPLRILVVEDEKDISTLIKITLESEHGHNVLEAGDGMEAIEAARRETPDLILMDLELPIMNGIEAAYRIKVLPETQHIPIIIMSANLSAVEWALQARDAGCAAHIRKPINFEALDRTIRQVRAQSQHVQVPA